MVVGEPIIDKYIYTSPLGMTNKDAIISTKILTQESFAGGSLAIANNLKSLGCDTSVIYPAAKDVETKKIIKKNIIKGIKLIPI